MKAKEYLEKVKQIHQELYKFDKDGGIMRAFKPMTYPPKEDGAYLTIRCGLGGIYTHIDEWKNGKWHLGVLDASTVVAYSRDTIDLNKL